MEYLINHTLHRPFIKLCFVLDITNTKFLQLKQDALGITSYDTENVLEEISSILKKLNDQEREEIKHMNSELTQLKVEIENLEKEQEKMKIKQTHFDEDLESQKQTLSQVKLGQEEMKRELGSHESRLLQVENEQETRIKQGLESQRQRFGQSESSSVCPSKDYETLKNGSVHDNSHLLNFQSY